MGKFAGRRSGQVLILVLLLVVVALAVGLSVASRNITNLRTSTQTEQSQRAFSAAEGGVEEVLSRLSSLAGAAVAEGGTDVAVDVGELKANVNVKASSVFESQIELGTVGQIDLSGLPGGSQVQIEWAKKGDSIEESSPASIEVTQVSDVGGVYAQTRTAFRGGTNGSNESGDFRDPNCAETASYKKCTRVTSVAGAKTLRIKPFWNRSTFKASCSGCTLPVQTYDVTSSATTELGVTRKVQVKRTALPALPAAFDYAIYSQSDLAK